MLTALRLAVHTVFLVFTITLYLGGLPAGGYSSKWAAFSLAAAYTTALIFAVLLRRGKNLPSVALAQLVTDQLVWTAFVYITGGATSGGTSLYGLTCLTGAILLGLRGAAVATVAGIAAYGGLCIAFITGLVPRPPDQPAEAYTIEWASARYPILVNILAMVVVASLASYLAERLRTTGGRLVQATQRAEEAERLAVLGRLAAALAHEIRNPLGSIAGSIELLRTGGTLSEQDQQLCGIIQRETQRLTDLMNDMLDLSRPRVPSKERFDLTAVAREVVELAARSGRGTDVRVVYTGPDHAEITADPAQMRQVLWNLVRNAIQASSAGDEVGVHIDVTDKTTILSISDRGPGIAPSARDRLFDAFFTTRSHGVGIGLAVVKRIVDDHAFTVEVDTDQDRGTTFRVIIQSSADPADELSTTRRAVPPTPHR
ncbi:MAG: two-component sensor histidine kinase [Polyangiaceae bacterium]|nr:two-component sensor histidine kinase [Polyangiaceae bacterium]